MPDTPRRMDVEAAAEAYLVNFNNLGVDYFFNSPGSDDAPYWEYLAKYGEEGSGVGDAAVPIHINCRHESLAVSMARGYTMLTGEPQVVKLHVNSGPLRGAMDVHTAYNNSVPMIILSSYSSSHERELRGGSPGSHYLKFQEPGGHENNLARYTKWSVSLDTNENAEYILSRAHRLAKSYPKGPVFVNISRELAFSQDKTETFFPEYTAASDPAPDATVMDEVVERLETAENPMILTTSLGRNPDSIKHLVALSEKLQIPVFEAGKKHNNFPMDHPLYVGASRGGTATPSVYFEKGVDLVFVIDSNYPWYPPVKGAPEDAEIIIANPNPLRTNNQYWNYPADLLVTAEPAQLLPMLIEAVDEFEGTRPVDWSREHEKWEQRWDEKVWEGEHKTPIDTYWLCHNIDKTLPDDALIHYETLVHTPVVVNTIKSNHHDKAHISQANRGGLGTGLGVALGAKLAEPDRLSVLLIGDGSFNYNPVMASFGLAQEYDLPILVILFNNRSYASMKRSLKRSYPEGWSQETDTYYGSHIKPDPDYSKGMEMWDGYGETVEDPGEITAALERGVSAVQDGRSALLNVILEDGTPELPEYR